MSLKDIRSECSDVAALLQPYVDAELAEDERERVSEHLHQCDPCRAAVSEQLWVQATLRAVEPEQAPASLRDQVLAGLDQVDTQRQKERPGLLSRWGSRARDFLRGGLVMVPAAAVAAALFFVARSGWDSTATLSTNRIGTALSSAELAQPKAPGQVDEDGQAPEHPDESSDPDAGAALADIEPQVDFPIQIVPPRAQLRQDVQLVGALLDDADSAARPGARLRYRVFSEGATHGQHVIDRQRPAIGPLPAGTPITFRGRQYVLQRTTGGEPVLHFERAGVAHMLRLESTHGGAPSSQDDFSILLDVAHRLAQD